MTVLEDIGPGAMVAGIVPGEPVQVVSIDWIGNQAVNLVYRTADSEVSETTLFRDDQSRLRIDERGRSWSFDGDGALLRLVTEAHRIALAHHFDPYLAIHTSRVDPLPHQISAVYGEMLPRQPLRFLLADDPGAGKTIMAGLLICGGVSYTRRYRIGQRLGQRCRHFLLMTATPHNGKEEDFQLFMALLDGDRFEGRFRDGVHYADTADMMRRLTKEELLRFDARPLFPERRAYTASYALSPDEAALYTAVTDYVRTEMNRVRRFAESDGRKRNNVGFALQILQRRLASSPAAIYQSLKRRRERLEQDLAETRLAVGGVKVGFGSMAVDDDTPDDLDEYGQDEVEDIEDRIATGATAAETAEQLRLEVATLRSLEAMALGVLHSGRDTKWSELDRILDDALMIDAAGNRRKLIVFTEPKDTLHYLVRKIRARLGNPDAVAAIHGGVKREERRKVVERFMTDRGLLVLVANDAAGEGVNLQRGHLMVNYDLPWNPNRIEQRFGRIHRIGQTEVCHLRRRRGEECAVRLRLGPRTDKACGAFESLSGSPFSPTARVSPVGSSSKPCATSASVWLSPSRHSNDARSLSAVGRGRITALHGREWPGAAPPRRR